MANQKATICLIIGLQKTRMEMNAMFTMKLTRMTTRITLRSTRMPILLVIFPCHSLTSIHRSEEHTSELQSLTNLVCRLLLEKKNAAGGPLAHGRCHH